MGKFKLQDDFIFSISNTDAFCLEQNTTILPTASFSPFRGIITWYCHYIFLHPTFYLQPQLVLPGGNGHRCPSTWASNGTDLSLWSLPRGQAPLVRGASFLSPSGSLHRLKTWPLLTYKRGTGLWLYVKIFLKKNTIITNYFKTKSFKKSYQKHVRR